MRPSRLILWAVNLAVTAAVFAVFSTGCSSLVHRSNAGIALLEEGPAGVDVVSRHAKYLGWAGSAPLAVALSPVAALAWATPWIDLPMAVDIASAPSIAFGYAFEAVVGFPLYAILFWAPKAERGGGEMRQPPRHGVPWGFVVEHREVAATPRPAAPLPPQLDAYYAVSPVAMNELRGDLRAALRTAAKGEDVSLALATGFPSTLELYPADDISPGERRPLVLMTPPSIAAFAARYLARRYARQGVHAAVVVPEKRFLEPALEPRDIEAKFRAAVVTARTVLMALASTEQVHAGELLYVGVSAGGIFGAVLLAVEPRIRRATLILPGGDLPRIIAESEESTVVAYREAWKERGLDAKELAAAVAREVRTDPLHLARHVDPRKVLIFLGAGDTSVPIATGLALRRAMGEPETYLLSGNHETAALCFGFILRRTDEFVLAEPPGVARKR